jgi:hypothetical protein
MTVKMLTHMHMVILHLVVLALLRRQWSLSGREGFGFLSPSRRPCEAGFGAFWGSETPIFYCSESQKRNGGERRSLW